MAILLSIIIPTYNTNKQTQELLEILDNQMQPNIEVIVIDDFSKIVFAPKKKYKWLKLIRTDKNKGTAGASRNIGLNIAKGKYIGYIDGDDMITEDYIATILFAIEHFMPDIIYLSWKSKVHNVVMKTRPPKWNCSVWCRVYKKSLIGKTRFKENLKIAEDWEFNTHIHPMSATVIKKQIYYYNIRENSLSRRNK